MDTIASRPAWNSIGRIAEASCAELPIIPAETRRSLRALAGDPSVNDQVLAEQALFRLVELRQPGQSAPPLLGEMDQAHAAAGAGLGISCSPHLVPNSATIRGDGRPRQQPPLPAGRRPRFDPAHPRPEGVRIVTGFGWRGRSA